MKTRHTVGRNLYLSNATWWYLTSLIVLTSGSRVAASHFPGGFDWAYTVASALASQKHNPQGSFWFASALALAMALLWPYVSALKHSQDSTHRYCLDSPFAACARG